MKNPDAVPLRLAVWQAWREADAALRGADGGPPGPGTAASQHRLCLETLELSVRGYCVERAFSPGRAREWVLSARRPPLWRRLLRPAPLLELTLRAGAGGTLSTVVAAPAGAIPRRGGGVVRLEPEQQRQLAAAHAGGGARTSRLQDWLRRIL